MTAAVASPTAIPVFVDGGVGDRERVRRSGKKLSSIFSNRNVFVLRKKLRSSSLSATVPSNSSNLSPSKPTSSRSPSNNLSASACRSSALSDYDHCSTSNSRLSTSPLSPHSAWSDDSDDEHEHHIHQLQSAAANMSDDDEQRDVVSPPSSSCSFSSSTSSSSSGSSSSSSSSASLSPLPTLISPRHSRTRRRLHSKESPGEHKEAHASLPPPSPIVALPPLHPHALTQPHASLPLAHLHALAASSPSVVGPPPSSLARQPHHQHQHQHQQSRPNSAANTHHSQTPPSSAIGSAPVKGGKHHRSHSASNQFILLQGGANGNSPSTARSPSTLQSAYGSPVLTSPFPSPLPSPHLQPAPFSPHHHPHHQHHQHLQQHQQQQLHYQHHQHHFRQPHPSPLVFSPQTNRSVAHFVSPVIYPSSPFLFMSHSQQQQSHSSPPSPTPATAMQQPSMQQQQQQPPSSPTPTAAMLQYADSGMYGAAATPRAMSPPPPMSSTPHPPQTASTRPVLVRAASMLDTSSLLHPHPRRSSMLDLTAFEHSQAQHNKPRSISSAASFPSFNSNGAHAAEPIAVAYPSPAEVQRLLASPLAALLGLSDSDLTRSHVPKALARCVQALNSPLLVASGPLSPTTAPSTPVKPASTLVVAPSPLSLQRELPPVVPSSPASYANIAASLPRRLSISLTASSASSVSSSERERRPSSASSSSSLPPSPATKPATVASPSVALRGIPSPLRLLPSTPISGASEAPSTAAPSLVTTTTLQTAQSHAAGGEVVFAEDARWQKRKPGQRKQRGREVKQPPSEQSQPTKTRDAASQVAPHQAESDRFLEAAVAPADNDTLTVASSEAPAAAEQSSASVAPVEIAVEQVWTAPPVVVTVAACLLPSPSVIVDKAMLAATAPTQPEKKVRVSRAGRRRASSNAGQSPAAGETAVDTAAIDSVPVKSSRICHAWSIRLSLMAHYSSLLSAISALFASFSAGATQHWTSVCTFYHSLVKASKNASKRRFVSRLRSLSHATQQQQQPQPLPAQRHSLRYRHHPLLERQKVAVGSEDEYGSSGGGEALIPRGLVLCMVLMSMFLGTVVITFLVFNRGQ